MAKLPVGLSYVGLWLVDYCPRQALADARRTLARLEHVDPAMLDETADEIAREAAREMVRLTTRDKQPEKQTEVPMIVSRLARDRARLMVIEVLGRTHRAPKEAGDTGNPARSRLFKEMEQYQVTPIDTVAVRVAPNQPERTEDERSGRSDEEQAGGRGDQPDHQEDAPGAGDQVPGQP